MDLFSTARGVGRVFLGLSASAALAAMLAGCGRDAEPEAGEGPQPQLPIAQPFEVARAGETAAIEFWIAADKDHPKGQGFSVGYWIRRPKSALLSSAELDRIKQSHTPMRLRLWQLKPNGERIKMTLTSNEAEPGQPLRIRPLRDDVSRKAQPNTPHWSSAISKGYYREDGSIKLYFYSFAGIDAVPPGRYLLEAETLEATPGLEGLSPELVLIDSQPGK